MPLPRIVGITMSYGVLYLYSRAVQACLASTPAVWRWCRVERHVLVALCRVSRSHRHSLGCGVSSGEVGLMVESAAPSPGRIFISYRREETAYPAGWLYDRLADRYGGGQIFKDVDSIELGDDFVEVITSAVGSCDVLLALVGDQWLTITDADGRRRLDDPDDFVRLEIEAALTRNVRVIPILVDGARMPRAEELPPSLAGLVRRQALELSPTRFDFDTSRLLKVLDKTLAEVRTAHDTAAAVSDLPESSSTGEPEPLPSLTTFSLQLIDHVVSVMTAKGATFSTATDVLLGTLSWVMSRPDPDPSSAAVLRRLPDPPGPALAAAMTAWIRSPKTDLLHVDSADRVVASLVGPAQRLALRLGTSTTHPHHLIGAALGSEQVAQPVLDALHVSQSDLSAALRSAIAEIWPSEPAEIWDDVLGTLRHQPLPELDAESALFDQLGRHDPAGRWTRGRRTARRNYGDARRRPSREEYA